MIKSGLLQEVFILKGHSGFENGVFRVLSAFGSSPNDTMHTN